MRICSTYPGMPNTEIFENLPQYKESLYCEWASNEKVATEAAYGAAIAGVRSLCAMKHMGLNMAADDPSMHSSQNEQNSRLYAKAARITLMEPSDSQECVNFMKEAYRISKEFNMSVLFRTTTRVSHFIEYGLHGPTGGRRRGPL